MYVERIPNRNSPPAILLRESSRDGDEIKKRTLANLSDCKRGFVPTFRWCPGCGVMPTHER